MYEKIYLVKIGPMFVGLAFVSFLEQGMEKLYLKVCNPLYSFENKKSPIWQPLGNFF